MNFGNINDIWENKLSKSLLELRPISELKFPYVSKNGYDENVPFIFVQNNLFVEIWNIGFYTDYQHTWETGLVHFTYTIKELLNGNELKIIDFKKPKESTIIQSAQDFLNKWISVYPDYKLFIEIFEQ